MFAQLWVVIRHKVVSLMSFDNVKLEIAIGHHCMSGIGCVEQQQRPVSIHQISCSSRSIRRVAVVGLFVDILILHVVVSDDVKGDVFVTPP